MLALGIVYLLLSPVLAWGLGRLLCSLLGRLQFVEKTAFEFESELSSYAVHFLLGQVFHLSLLFFALSLGLSFPQAIILAWSPLLLVFRLKLPALVRPQAKFSFSAAFFVGAMICIGVSLVDPLNGIKTPWKNSYGDLAFHLGMISSFVFGENFPPEYHLFAGERLSYPFFVNLWTAELWSFAPSYEFLSYVFLQQWLLITLSIYLLLSSTGMVMLPWLLLFGGGSFFVLGANSGENIGENIPWTLFLTTTWVPQRAALFGVALSAAVLYLARPLIVSPESSENCGDGKKRLALCGVLLGFAPLVHLHICFAVGLVLALILALKPLLGADAERAKLQGAEFLCFAGFAVLSFIWLPWLLGKSSIMEWVSGWVVGGAFESLEGFARLQVSALMWLKHAWILPLGIALVLVSKRLRLLGSVLLLCFILGNSLIFAVWQWDQLKFFLGLFLVLLFAWSWSGKVARYAQVFVFVLIYPTAYELLPIIDKGENFTVYDKKSLEIAEELREKVPASAVLAASQSHNAPATLSGRRLYAGYEGTLSSHGLEYKERVKRLRQLESLSSCEAAESAEPCPRYLVWDDQGKRQWTGQRPESFGYEKLGKYTYALKG